MHLSKRAARDDLSMAVCARDRAETCCLDERARHTFSPSDVGLGAR